MFTQFTSKLRLSFLVATSSTDTNGGLRAELVPWLIGHYHQQDFATQMYYVLMILMILTLQGFYWGIIHENLQVSLLPMHERKSSQSHPPKTVLASEELTIVKNNKIIILSTRYIHPWIYRSVELDKPFLCNPFWENCFSRSDEVTFLLTQYN